MNRTTSIILIILSLGIFYTFTSPQYGDAQELATQASEYRNVLDNADRIGEARDNLLSNYEGIPEAEKERLAKVLPDNVDAVGLARDLDAMAAAYGITIKSIDVKTASDDKTIVLPDHDAPYDKATVSFSFISTYANFAKFLADIETSLRLMDVKSVHFQVGPNGLYEHRITLETYWLK